MRRAGGLALLVAVVGGLGSAIQVSAAAPPHALVQAIERTNAAQTEQMSLVEKIRYGGALKATVHLKGVEEQHGTIGSFVFSTTPATAGLSSASEIVTGSKAYIHYPVLARLHASDSRVKPWILVDTSSSLGVDPASLGALRADELRNISGLRRAGAGKVGGTAVTRYTGTLSMRKNAASPEMQNLFAHLPSASAVVFDGIEKVEFDVGTDGFVHRFTSVITVPVRGSGTLRIDLSLVFGKFNAPHAALTEPDPSEVMTLQQFDQLIGASGTADADDELVHKVSLTPGQVGSGYVLSQIPGGQLVAGETTLDFCGGTYRSESLRTARYQVTYDKKGSSFSASNEVVAYKPGGAKQALGEVKRAAAACKQGTVKAPAGTPFKQIDRHTTLIHDPHLPKGTIAILDVESAVVQGKRKTGYTMEIYQVRGNVLSAVYGFGTSAAVVQAKALKAAEQSAANLKKNVAGSTALIA